MWKFVVCVLVVASGNAWALDNNQTNGANATGTWQCNCMGSGTCTVLTTGSGMSCTKGPAGTCAGSCEFTTTTTGLHPISPARVPPSALRPGGGEAAPNAR